MVTVVFFEVELLRDTTRAGPLKDVNSSYSEAENSVQLFVL